MSAYDLCLFWNSGWLTSLLLVNCQMINNIDCYIKYFYTIVSMMTPSMMRRLIQWGVKESWKNFRKLIPTLNQSMCQTCTTVSIAFSILWVNQFTFALNFIWSHLVGAMAHSLDFRKSSGGFIHGFRYSGMFSIQRLVL